MKLLRSAFMAFALCSAAVANASQFASVTLSKIRYWSDSDTIYVVLAGSGLNPAGCASSGFWEIKASSAESKQRVYALAMLAKAVGNPVRVEIHDTVCSGVGTSGYPTVWMLEVE